MTIIFTDVVMDLSGADKADKLAALQQVTQENVRRAAVEPTPETPLATTPDAALLASYKTVIQLQTLPNAHNSWIGMSGEAKNETRKDAFNDLSSLDQDAVDAILFP